jgi:hypothetical protein
MERFRAVVVFGALVIAQVSLSSAMPQQAPNRQSSFGSERAAVDLPALPPVPRGKSTIIGGAIKKVDPVRDVITLKAFGQRPMKILFDERTQVFRDGKITSLRDLGSADHASVQTVLDGTSVYAISIHMLSLSPEGEYEGRVLAYNPGTRELTVSAELSREPIKLLVSENTLFARIGQQAIPSQQAGTADLVKDALISVKFESNGKGRGLVTQIAVLAMPGSEFMFNGDLSTLDLHSGMLVLTDPRDSKSYQVYFNSASVPTSKDLHPGDHVRVTARFDGVHYVASSIAVN